MHHSPGPINTDIRAISPPQTSLVRGPREQRMMSPIHYDDNPPGYDTADFTQLQPQQRRLSITFSSSSSGASLSPILEPNTAVPEPTYDDPTAELAHCARQSAGVMLAVPMHGHAHPHHSPKITTTSMFYSSISHTIPTYSTTSPTASNHIQSKLPFPCNPRPAHAPPSPSTKSSTNSSAASTPPPATPPPSVSVNGGVGGAGGAQPMAGLTSHLKTSHTTIEQ